MIIRREQMEVFVRIEREKFEERTLEALKRNWPDQAARRGEEGARQSVRMGIERAEKYGLTLEPHVHTYINLMWLYGDRFDEDPRCAWAPGILRNSGLEPEEKVERLVEHVREAGSRGQP